MDEFCGRLSSAQQHTAEHRAFRCVGVQPPSQDLIRIGSRRWFLETGIAGLAGLSLANLLQQRAAAGETPRSSRKAVILVWLSGGPSHLDTWDPKPSAPLEERGPFGSISTKVSGTRVCEHLPLLAGMIDRLAIVRSMECRGSDDHRSAVMQTGNSEALKDVQPTLEGPLRGRWPSMGAVSAKFRGPNDPRMPAFVGMGSEALTEWHSDIWGEGQIGAAYGPVREAGLAGRLDLPAAVNATRAQDRDALRTQLDRLRRDVDAGQHMEGMDHYERLALDMVLSGKACEAFQIEREPDSVRDAYGRDSFGEKALLARRLVEAGVTFVIIAPRFGVFDVHGDDVIWGGLIKGMQPLYPSVDRSLSTLIGDLERRGLAEDTLVLTLGEFGRSPQISKTGGRTHWPNCMSVLVAGGGAGRGQVIGSTDARGYHVQEDRVFPADLAATVFRHLEIDLATHWTDAQGRPHSIVPDGGRPIPGLI